MRGRPGVLTVLLAGLFAAPGCAPGPDASGDWLDDRLTYGQRLLARRCRNCHDLPSPRITSRAAWERDIRKMQKRIHLPAADWDTLLALVPPDPAPPRGIPSESRR